MIKKYKYVSSDLEFTDRYNALGLKSPNPNTMCKGDCEGTGFFPVYKNEENHVFMKLWCEAEKISHSDDGWHFIRCPRCNGTGEEITDD